MVATCALVAETLAQQASLESLSRSTGLPIIGADDPGCQWLLVLTSERLELRQCGAAETGPVYVDFVAGRNRHRRRFGGGRGQPLARAVGLKRGHCPRVIDATGGFGRDAFVLATLGCEVLLLERSPVVTALLQDAMRRALGDSEAGPILRRMSLQCIDSIPFLNNIPVGQRPDVVYLDPMYPKREKAARVKKELYLLQQLVGADRDSSELLQKAIDCARYRVVVKRPRSAPYLGGATPSMFVKSPNTRYDVYIRQGFEQAE